jgi:uncharacterized coiled-coil protein SlyX
MENNNTIAIIISIIALLGGVIPAIVMYIKDAGRNKALNARDAADHEKIISEAAVTLLEPLNKRVIELEARIGNQDIVIQDQERRIRALTAEIESWKDGAERLVNQLKSHKIQPVWEPTCTEHKA